MGNTILLFFCPYKLQISGLTHLLLHIRWTFWFSVRLATATHREIFYVNALRGKLNQLVSPNLLDPEKQDDCPGHFFKNYLHFLLAGSHKRKVESLHR